MRLPIGIQDFTTLREANMVYVDKTKLLAPLLETGRYFLSRPRRFGKSLLLSTIKAVFAGRKDLFSGLWLEKHHDFMPRPMIRLDFSNINFTTKTLDEGIVDWLRIEAQEYDYELQGSNARDAFRELIIELSKRGKVVVLIDEYDKPLTDYLLEPEKRKIHQTTLKSVYGTLKPLDAYLHLVFLTGVSKFGKLSLFSDLNNLQDISLNPNYNTLCGYTLEEIETNLGSFIPPILENLNSTSEAFWEATKRWYNGYSWTGKERVYCPFSFLLFLENKEFKSYWYATGTPTFLLELIRNQQINPLEFEDIGMSDRAISVADIDPLDAVSLMFQTGYLTIHHIARSLNGTSYQLTYPNEEVRSAFSSGLLLEYGQMFPHQVDQLSFTLRRTLLNLDWAGFFAAINQMFARVPYEIFPKQEAYVHSLLHLMLISTGFRVQSQVQTSLGRMDTLLETDTHYIIFELKIGGTLEMAVQQISSHQYANGLSGKPVLGVGVVFDLESKSIGGWESKEL